MMDIPASPGGPLRDKEQPGRLMKFAINRQFIKTTAGKPQAWKHRVAATQIEPNGNTICAALARALTIARCLNQFSSIAVGRT